MMRTAVGIVGAGTICRGFAWAGLCALCAWSTACDDDSKEETDRHASSSDNDDKDKPDAAPSDAAQTAQSLRVTITVPSVPPGTEGTQCLKTRLGNSGAIKVNKVHNRLFGETHHFVVSTVTDPNATEEGLYECPPFRAPLTGAPLTITQKHDEVVTLPEGVGYALEENQLMHLELHYINNSDTEMDVSAEAELFLSTNDQDIQEAGFLIVGNLAIKIPPRSMHSTGEVYMPVPAQLDGVHYYAFTGHTHWLGTNVSVDIVPSEDGEATPIYHLPNFDWTAPEVVYKDPPVQVPAGGGFRFSCDWYNPTDDTIGYGESARTEMCFFWAYYYPKHPTQLSLLASKEKSIYADAGTDAPKKP